VSSGATAALVQDSDAGEAFGGAPVELETVAVPFPSDEKLAGLVDDLYEIRRVVGQIEQRQK
jgi:hypothetical protein